MIQMTITGETLEQVIDQMVAIASTHYTGAKPQKQAKVTKVAKVEAEETKAEETKAEETKAEETKTVEPAGKEVTTDDIRSLWKEKKDGGVQPSEMVKLFMEYGVKKIDEIQPQNRAEFYNKVKAL